MLDKSNRIVPDDLAEFSAADTIEETLSVYHILQSEFAKRIGISEKHLSQILHRKAFMSPKVALSIEAVTGIPAYMLLASDTRYRLAHTPKPTPSDKVGDLEFLKPYDWAKTAPETSGDLDDNIKPETAVEKGHVNVWHTEVAKNHDFQADLDQIGNIADEPRKGREL